MYYTTIQAAQAIIADRQREAARARQTSSFGPATRRSSLRWLAALLSGAMLVAACSAPKADVESPIIEDQAIEMADAALQALNAGDYTGWSQDWSDTMKSAINEQAFLAFRDQVQAQFGDYVAIKSARGGPGETPGFYRWTFQVQFEQSDYGMWFGFKQGSPLIEGVQLEEPTA